MSNRYAIGPTGGMASARVANTRLSHLLYVVTNVVTVTKLLRTM